MLVGTDFDDVRSVIVDYLEGMIYGDPDRLRRAFHPMATCAGHYAGQYEMALREDFLESWKLFPVEPPGTPDAADIVSLEITGNVAVAKVTDSCFGDDFTDYLVLIKDNGVWQIVSKAFYTHPAA